MTTKPSSHKRAKRPILQIAKGRRRWTDEHEGKLQHATVDEANVYLRTHEHRVTEQYDVYQCRWGDSYEYGENEPLHWHVGRKRRQFP